MVDQEVKKEVIEILISQFPDAPEEMIWYAFKCRILDINKCRIAVIKRHYYSMLETMNASSAKSYTAEKFCLSEKTVENLIYHPYYKDIRI